MSDPDDYEHAVIENGDDSEETLNEIRKNLLDDFETAKTVTKDGSSGIGEREPVKVFLRVKPFTSKEIAEGESQGCLEMENTSTVLMHPPKTSFTYKQKARSGFTAETVHRHRFTFSRVFGPDTNQKAFFEETSLNFVKDFIDGQNCLVFSYGVTNAGKVSPKIIFLSIKSTSQISNSYLKLISVKLKQISGKLYLKLLNLEL